jgi:(p)ppGpp synthase/HD superfamily hydrolase
VTPDEVGRAFGRRVEQLVVEVTDVSCSADGNRAARKSLDRGHLAVASPEGQTIKLADLIDNARSIATHDPRFARTYLAEMEALLQVLKRGDPRLLELARQTLDDCRRGIS